MLPAEYVSKVGRYLIKERQAGREHFLFSDFVIGMDLAYAKKIPEKALPYLSRVREQLDHTNKNLASRLNDLIESM